jgi:alpha-mannosidase
MPLNLRSRWIASALASLSVLVLFANGQQPGVPSKEPKPVLYVVGTSHLDSQWNWTVQDTIRQFVPNTFFENFKRFEQYPNYTFNYEGAIHYMWFKEYHPEAWPTVQKYVSEGRWKLAGSWINAVDTNVPSAESLMRQALYGNRFFRQEFGRVSRDVYLPDCFGFSFALPSIATHCGLPAFSTQKLTWGSSYGIPFPIGRWKGVDGSTVVAALNPGDYVTKIRSDISIDPNWSKDLTSLGNGRKVGFKYFGTGDIGGAPDDDSVNWLEKSIANSAGNLEVRNTSSDQMARDLTPEETAALPEYEGELTMKTHGVGCYTSQAAMKRFNRENELLADAAEHAAVAAEFVTGIRYPGDRLREAWIRVLWHQFHDDLTGTSIPQAYQFSWNDELVSANQFAAVLTGSAAAVSSMLDTRGTGVPLVIYNPVSTSRRDLVEATVTFNSPAPGAIRVIDLVTQRDVPSQVLETQDNKVRILFLANVPSVSFKVYEVRPGTSSRKVEPSLTATESSLENARYKVKIDSNGDLASIIDRDAGQELLKAPVRLELRNNPSPDKPAWRILWDTVNSPPREHVTTPEIRVVEQGPVRVAVQITRKAAGSTFVQRVTLEDGGDRVDIENLVDWKSPNTLLKASFPFAASNPKATYDLGLGTIQRGNNTPDHYEVPAQKWADLTDASGSFGAAVLNDSKYGWDKPADNVLRLTLLHTAKARAYPYQSSNDLGHHRFVYSIAGHRGDWRDGRVPERAAALNQPLIAFQTEAHSGVLGRRFSMLSLDDVRGQITVRALKKAEDSDEIVLRVQELYGQPAQTRLKLAAPIRTIREINAAEETARPFAASRGGLVIEFKPYQSRTFALRLQTPAPQVRTTHAAAPIDLPYNLDGISTDANRTDGDFDAKGQTLAGELLPQKLQLGGLPFRLGSSAPGVLNVLVPKEQRIALPSASSNRLYILAAAVGADTATGIVVGHNAARTITVSEWQGPIGQWDSRLKEPRQLREVHVAPMTRGQSWTAEAIQADLLVEYDPATGNVKGMDQIRRGFVKRDEIAWVGTHRHAPDGNQPYIASYIFVYAIDLPPGTREVRLPNDPRIRILAMTLAHEPYRVWPARALYASELSR